MLSGLPNSTFEIVDGNGVLKGKVKGVFSSTMISINDVSANIVVGDELRRTIPNGTEEAYEVIDPVYYEAMYTTPAHFQVKVRRKGAFKAGTGGNYTINMSGHNARVNVQSTDNSTNTFVDNRIYSELRSAISEKIDDEASRVALLSSINDMEKSSGDKSEKWAAYQRFMSSAADHMSVVGPFLPALGSLLG